MKRLTTYLFLIAFICLDMMAANIYRVNIRFDSNPSDADTVVIQGDTLTFKNTVTDETTQIGIGASAALTAAALQTWLEDPDNAFDGIVSSQTSTNVTILGDVDVVVTVTAGGGWATIDTDIDAVSNFPLMLPAANINATTRETRINQLVAAFDYATDAFAASLDVLANFVNVTETQTITGAKTFSGAVATSSSDNVIAGGVLTNIAAGNVKFTTTNDYLNFGGFGGITVDETWNVPVLREIVSTDPLTWGDPIDATDPEPGFVLNTVMADRRFGQLGAANDWTEANTFTLISGILTNATGGFTNIWSTNSYLRNAYITGTIALTNINPNLRLHDSDGDTDNKVLYLTMYDGDLQVLLADDNDANFAIGLSVDRTDTTFDGVTVHSGILNVPDFYATGDMRTDSTANIGTFLGVGTTNATAPTDLSSGLIFTNATVSASADPLNGVAMWSAAGRLMARSSGSSEGAGANWNVFNRASVLHGSSTDYNLTTSYAHTTFGSSIPLTLPTAGTYMVTAIVTVDADGSTGGDSISFKFYNVTDAADVSNSVRTVSNIDAGKRDQVRLENLITVTGSTVIHLYGINSTAARGTVDSEQTSIGYVRLY